MKYILIILAISILNKCNDKAGDKTGNGMPSCVQKKIDQIKKEPVWNPPAEVNEYTYQDKQVFLFTSNCCDQYIMLYDGSCNYICAPSGGITGKGDGKCNDFYNTAKLVRLVWKDPR
jgi:hypothetical protein